MSADVVLVGTSVISCGVAVAAGVRLWVYGRNTPKLNQAQTEKADAEEDHLRATIELMSRETNRDRDFRIWQLEQHYDREIMPWARRFVAQFERVVNLLRIEIEKTGGTMPDIEIPVLPELPEPPHG
jgi:glutamate synthase domain-containing protein 3